MRGEPASHYPTFTCTDQEAAYGVAVQASKQAEAASDAPHAKELIEAMVTRYTPAATCNTTTLRTAELKYAQNLSHIAHARQVCENIIWLSCTHCAHDADWKAAYACAGTGRLSLTSALWHNSLITTLSDC